MAKALTKLLHSLSLAWCVLAEFHYCTEISWKILKKARFSIELLRSHGKSTISFHKPLSFPLKWQTQRIPMHSLNVAHLLTSSAISIEVFGRCAARDKTVNVVDSACACLFPQPNKCSQTIRTTKIASVFHLVFSVFLCNFLFLHREL